MSEKISVTPLDDPNATNAEIEIIASSHQADGKLYRVLCKVKLTSGDANKAIEIALRKRGYKIWHHSKVSTILDADDGYHYAWGVFERI